VQAVEKIPLCTAPLGEDKQKTGLLGPIVSARQYASVMGHIEGAIKEGATVLTGGKRPACIKKGFFVAPTVLRTRPDMSIWNQEVFGPVLSVATFKTEEEALRMANDTEYGLAGAVFSLDQERAQRVVNGLRVGVTWINCSQPTFCQLPWGGQKKSGFGRDLGEAGFQSYLDTKQVVTCRNPSKQLGWYEMPKQP